MTAAEYRRMTTRELAGREVVAVREFQNGTTVVPAGMRLTIEGKRSGLDLVGAPCDCCRVRVRIGKVPPEFVELVEVTT